ncbi:MAG: hypothetical protein QNJ43_16160 [Breoghania sp.]|nr:hypothetical protein [Breoghania sp.]
MRLVLRLCRGLGPHMGAGLRRRCRFMSLSGRRVRLSGGRAAGLCRCFRRRRRFSCGTLFRKTGAEAGDGLCGSGNGGTGAHHAHAASRICCGLVGGLFDCRLVLLCVERPQALARLDLFLLRCQRCFRFRRFCVVDSLVPERFMLCRLMSGCFRSRCAMHLRTAPDLGSRRLAHRARISLMSRVARMRRHDLGPGRLRLLLRALGVMWRFGGRRAWGAGVACGGSMCCGAMWGWCCG